MSDEPTPTPTPSLRLKPRLRPDASATPPPSIPKIAIAQPLDNDGLLPAGERKVFTAPAPEPSEPSTEPSSESTSEASAEQPRKLTLTPKLTADAKTKRFSLPAANPSAGLKRLPPSITPGVGEDGAPQDDDDSPLAPAKPSYASAETAEPIIAAGDSTEVNETSRAQDEENPSENSAADSEAMTDESGHDASATIAETPLDAPHPAADVPTRFSAPSSEKETGRFKLKPRLSAPENGASPSGALRPPLPTPGAAGTPPPGIKIVPTPPVGPSTGSLPVKVPLQPRGTPKGTRQVRRVVVQSGRSRFLKYFLIGTGSIAAVGLAIGGFMGFRYLSQLEKHPAPAPVIVAHVPVKKPAAHPALKEDTAAPQSEAGRLIAKAKAVASAQADEINAVTDEATGDTAAAHPKAVPTAANAKGTPANAGANLNAIPTAAPSATSVAQTPARPVAHEPEPKKAPPPPSAEFRTIIVNLRVNGVFQGAHPRALLNGRLMNAGEILDQTMMIRFTGIDAVHKQLLFEDGTGAQMQRHY